MPLNRQVYLLDSMRLPPETIAVAFAKTSRSPQSFREIAAELTEEKSAEFHEKWVVGYGHASVAEHAVLHIAVENVSRLAVECLESNRLASYTEKSTRYQKWDAQAYCLPPELETHPLRALYEDTIGTLFETYQHLLEPVRQVIEQRLPRREDESESAYDRRIRSEYVDVCRFALPAAALANVGVTINARALEHALRKMLSHPLAEVRQMGEEIKQVALERLPTLIRYVEPVAYLEQTARDFTRQAGTLPPAEDADWCRLLSWDAQGENRILAAALYRFGHMPFAQALQAVENATAAERAHLAEMLLAGRGRHDIPLRELEYAYFTVDVLLDQGAYFELKRHRMMTQTAQRLSALHGYALPKAIVEAGMAETFRLAMRAAHRAYLRLSADLPEAASYVVPNAYNRRVLLHFNLRTALHWLALRSAPNAHFSMRRVAQRVAQELRSVLPALGRYLLVEEDETWQDIEARHFAATAERPE